MDKATKRLLKQNAELEFLKDKGIVKCRLSGHEMPCRVDIIETYVKGKKFKRLKDSRQTGKLPDHLSASVMHKGKIFCALTNCYINCSVSNIERHTTGRRYQQALQQFQQGSLKPHVEQTNNEGVGDDTKTTSADSETDDEINDQEDTINDDKMDNQDDFIDDHDKYVDQHKQSEDLIQTTASVSKQRRKRKNLSVTKTSKDKQKKARIS